MRTCTVWVQSVCKASPGLAGLACDWGEEDRGIRLGEKAAGEDSALLAGSVNFCGPHVSKEDGAWEQKRIFPPLSRRWTVPVMLGLPGTLG